MLKSRSQHQDDLLDLIERAYAASEEPRLWDTLLLSLSETLNARGVALLNHDLRHAGAVSTNVRVDPAALSLYDEHFNHLDPWAQGAGKLGVGRPATDEALISRDELLRSEYFTDFANRYDISRLLTVVIERSTNTNIVLSILRGERDAPFAAQDRRFLETLTPHLQRALQIHKRIHIAEQERAATIEALDTLRCAVFLVDAEAKVVLANRRGSEMLAAGDGISVDRGRLRAAVPRETQLLRETCAVVAKTRAASLPHPGAALVIGGRPSQRLPLQVLVTPATSPVPVGLADPRIAALVFVIDPADEQRPSEALLQQLYELTEAESHVAARIAAGRSLEEIAAERGSAIETVRRQNKQILSKTGARNRSELVRWLSTIPVQ